MGRLEGLWAGVCAQKVDGNFLLYSEARGSRSKEIRIVRKLILLSLNFLNMSFSFSRATERGREGRRWGTELHPKALSFLNISNIKWSCWGTVTTCVWRQLGNRNSTSALFLFQVARSHPWTPKKMETMEQSNLGSKPWQSAGGAADGPAARCT